MHIYYIIILGNAHPTQVGGKYFFKNLYKVNYIILNYEKRTSGTGI